MVFPVKKIIIKFLRYFFYAVAVLFLAELAIRIFLPPLYKSTRLTVGVNDSRGYMLRPNTEIIFPGRHQDVAIRINSQGLREDSIISRHRQNGKIRIGTFGDSEVFGWSVQKNETFQEKLEELDTRLEIINFGVPGYNTVNVADSFSVMTEKFDFDIFVYLFNENDFDSSLPGISFSFLAQINSELVQRLMLANMVWVQKKNQAERYSRKNINAVLGGLLKMAQICRKKHIYFILLFQNMEDSVILKADKGLEKYFNKGTNAEVIDITHVFKKYPLWDAHLSPQGHSELALFLYNTSIAKYLDKKQVFELL